MKTIAELQSELARQSQLLGKLQTQRKKVAKQLDQIDKKIAQLDGKETGGKKSAPKKTLKRAKNKQSLNETLAAVLKGKKAVSIGDATKLVLAAGYKSNSRQFQGIVNQTLLKDKRFKKVGRGMYALKSSTASKKSSQNEAKKDEPQAENK